MPVLVEPDAAKVASLLAAMPAGAHGVNAPDRMMAWLDQHPDEYVVVLGPSLALDDALAACDDLRIARPTVSVVLVADALDTTLLTRAMKSGARDVVQTDDVAAIGTAIRQAHQLFQALRGPGGAVQLGRVVTVFSPKGGVGKTTMGRQPRARPHRGRRAQGVPRRPRPRLRRRRDHHAAVPHPLDRAGRRRRGHPRHGPARRPPHPAPGLPDGPGRAAPPRRPRPGDGGAGPAHPAHAARRLRLRRRRHLAELRRPGARRPRRDRRVHHRRHARRADAEERQGRPRDAGDARHRQRSPPPHPQPGRRRRGHRRRQGRVDPRHAGRHPGLHVGRHRRRHQRRHADRGRRPAPRLERGDPCPRRSHHRRAVAPPTPIAGGESAASTLGDDKRAGSLFRRKKGFAS